MKRQEMLILSGKEIIERIQGHQLHPFPYTHTLWKASDLVFDVFSHMSKKFKIIEYTKPTTFFIFLVTPRKNLVATAPNKNVLF